MATQSLTAQIRADLSGFNSEMTKLQAQSKATTDAVGKNFKALENDITRVERTAQRVSRGDIFGGVGSSARKSKSEVSSFSDILGGGFSRAAKLATVQIAALVGVMTALVAATVPLAQRFITLERSLIISGKSLLETQKQIQSIKNFADQLGISVLATVDTFRRLTLAAQNTALSGRPIRELSENFLTLASAVGLTQDQIDRAGIQLGQVVSIGKVAGEEIRTLAEATGLNFNAAIAKVLGVSTSAMLELRQQGRISSVAVARAIEQMATEAGQRLESLGMSIESALAEFNRLQNRLTELRQEAGRNLIPVINELSKGLISLFEGFNNITMQQGNLIQFAKFTVEVFREIGNAFGFVIDQANRVINFFERSAGLSQQNNPALREAENEIIRRERAVERLQSSLNSGGLPGGRGREVALQQLEKELALLNQAQMKRAEILASISAQADVQSRMNRLEAESLPVLKEGAQSLEKVASATQVLFERTGGVIASDKIVDNLKKEVEARERLLTQADRQGRQRQSQFDRELKAEIELVKRQQERTKNETVSNEMIEESIKLSNKLTELRKELASGLSDESEIHSQIMSLKSQQAELGIENVRIGEEQIRADRERTRELERQTSEIDQQARSIVSLIRGSSSVTDFFRRVGDRVLDNVLTSFVSTLLGGSGQGSSGSGGALSGLGSLASGAFSFLFGGGSSGGGQNILSSIGSFLGFGGGSSSPNVPGGAQGSSGSGAIGTGLRVASGLNTVRSIGSLFAGEGLLANLGSSLDSFTTTLSNFGSSASNFLSGSGGGGGLSSATIAQGQGLGFEAVGFNNPSSLASGLGTGLVAAGVGIGVRFGANELLNQIGIEGRAAAGLSGAAGGAASGAIVGSSVGPIGTAAGALIGAFVGAAASLLGTSGTPKIRGQIFSGANVDDLLALSNQRTGQTGENARQRALLEERAQFFQTPLNQFAVTGLKNIDGGVVGQFVVDFDTQVAELLTERQIALGQASLREFVGEFNDAAKNNRTQRALGNIARERLITIFEGLGGGRRAFDDFTISNEVGADLQALVERFAEGVDVLNQIEALTTETNIPVTQLSQAFDDLKAQIDGVRASAIEFGFDADGLADALVRGQRALSQTAFDDVFTQLANQVNSVISGGLAGATSIRDLTLTPAGVFERQREQLDALQAEFDESDIGRRLQLFGDITRLSQQLASGAESEFVFGSERSEGARSAFQLGLAGNLEQIAEQLGTEVNAIVDPVQGTLDAILESNTISQRQLDTLDLQLVELGRLSEIIATPINTVLNLARQTNPGLGLQVPGPAPINVNVEPPSVSVDVAAPSVSVAVDAATGEQSVVTTPAPPPAVSEDRRLDLRQRLILEAQRRDPLLAERLNLAERSTIDIRRALASDFAQNEDE